MCMGLKWFGSTGTPGLNPEAKQFHAEVRRKAEAHREIKKRTMPNPPTYSLFPSAILLGFPRLRVGFFRRNLHSDGAMLQAFRQIREEPLLLRGKAGNIART